jgi:Holliday junction resolvase
MKRGYKAEYEVRKKLSKEYLPQNIVKVAIGGATDFLVLEPKGSKVLKIVEVKTTKKNQWYPGEHDIKQFKAIEKFSKNHQIPIEYWIKIKGQWKIFSLKEIKKYFQNDKRRSSKTSKKRN